MGAQKAKVVSDEKLISDKLPIRPNKKVNRDRLEKETVDEAETAEVLFKEISLKKGNKVFTEKTLLHD